MLSAMRTAYAVTWQDETGETHAGKLQLSSSSVILEGWAGDAEKRVEIPYLQLAHVGLERESDVESELVLEVLGGGQVRIAGLAEPEILGALSDAIAAARGAASVSRMLVIVPLQPGSAERAAELLTNGPPFDPEALGLDRHEVYLTDEEAVFVFETMSRATFDRLVSDASLWAAAAAWNDLIAGPPRLAVDAYSWKRSRDGAEGDLVSFAATPGPGDSEGGDIYAP
jgi:hypothetical protein